MWQLRERWKARGAVEGAEAEPIRLESPRFGGLVTLAATLLLAAAGGYLGSRASTPTNPQLIATCAFGGGALGFLLTAVPQQALRVVRRGWILLGVAFWRRRLRRLADRARARLSSEVERLPAPETIRDLAVAEYLAEAPEEAELQLHTALSISPGLGSAINDLGVVLAERGRCDEAAGLFMQALATESAEEATRNCALVAPLVSVPEALEQMLRSSGDRTGAVTLNNLGVSYARLGRWEKAEAGFRAAAQQNGGLAAAYANLGLIAYRRGQLQEAADRVMEAERLAPREPELANYLGVILAGAGQFELARQYLRRALRAEPANARVQVNAMAVEALAGRWDVAVKGLGRIVGEHRELGDAHYDLALAHLAVGDPVAAAANAALAIAQGDTSSEAYTALAVAQWEAGHRAKALTHFQSATTAEGAGSVAAANLGRALLIEGEVERALRLLERAHMAWPADVDLAFDLATAVLAQGAATYHEGLADEERGKLRAGLQRAVSGLEAGAHRGNGLAAEAHVNLGLYLYIGGQYEKAADHFEEALRTGPKTRELQYLVGTSLGRASEQQTLRTTEGVVASDATGRQFMRRAVPYLERACEAREVMADAAYNLGRCLYALESFEAALAAFRRALTVERSEELHILAGLAAARQAQELRLMARGHLLMTEAKRDQLRERAQELLNVAVHYLTQALMRNEMNPVVHGNLGIAYMMRNRERDIESALRHWERMRAIGGGAMERRWAELSQIDGTDEAARAAFDDRDLKLRGLHVIRWLAVAPPAPGPLRFLLEPMAVHEPWRVIVESNDLRQALGLRARISADEARLARLRV